MFEAVRVDETIRRLINDNGDEAIIARHAFLNAPNLGSAARELVRTARPRRKRRSAFPGARPSRFRPKRSMADFAYRVIDAAGREREGRISAASDAQARAALIRKSFHIVSVAPAPPRKPLLSRDATARLSPKQLTLFTRQMSSLMSVSPLEEALRTISRQTEKANARAVLINVHGGVMEGQSLAEAMAREPRSFPPLYRAMISAGESSGSLPVITERLAMLLEQQAEVRGKLISALAYPIILALVALGVVAGLMISVVPRVVEQFDNAQTQLPLITRIVIGISAFLADWWWAILAAMLLAGVAFWRAMKCPRSSTGSIRCCSNCPLSAV